MDSAQADRWISRERLAPYLAAANQDFELALRIYDWNLRLSSSLFESVADFEVLLRNSIDLTLHERVGGPGLGWLESESTLTPQTMEFVSSAKTRIVGTGKSPTRARVVAALSFGFWTALFRRAYEPLWVAHLYVAFPHGDGTRKPIARELEALGRLRNRIAHHEPVFDRDLVGDLQRCVDLASWIEPEAAVWIRDRSSIHQVLARDPRGQS